MYLLWKPIAFSAALSVFALEASAGCSLFACVVKGVGKAVGSKEIEEAGERLDNSYKQTMPEELQEALTAKTAINVASALLGQLPNQAVTGPTNPGTNRADDSDSGTDDSEYDSNQSGDPEVYEPHGPSLTESHVFQTNNGVILVEGPGRDTPTTRTYSGDGHHLGVQGWDPESTSDENTTVYVHPMLPADKK